MKRNIFSILLTGMMVVMLWSCTTLPENEQELQTYVADPSNGVSKQKQSGGLDFTVTFRPTDLLVAQTLDGDLEAAKVSSLRKQYGSYAYFVLEMKAEGRDVLYGTAADQAHFNEALQTLSFRMGDYVTLTTANRDTIPVADYTYARTFGMARQTSLLFAFNKEQFQGQEWVSFNLNEFGLRAGDQRFRFKVSDLESVPHIPFELQNVNQELSAK
ncbi:MAG: hypothetical protein AAFO69_05385 [Bacteroidota bacterium]